MRKIGEKEKKSFVHVEKSHGEFVAQIFRAIAYGKLMAFLASFGDCYVSATSNFRSGFKTIAGPTPKFITTSYPVTTLKI